MSFYGDASESDFWREFTNNFATDLAPIISLFGEQVTKQYLTESTTFLDSLIFAIAPLGVITAVVSVIRVRGTPFLRSLIGRAREPHGSAELELCSSTSQDVSEMWSNGGVCRVLGRPQILEFIYKEPTSLNDYTTTFNNPPNGRKKYTINYPACGIYLVKDVLTDLHEPSTINHGWIEITPTHSGPRRLLRQYQNLHTWLKKRLDLLRRKNVETHASDPITMDAQELPTIAHEEGKLKADTEKGPPRSSAFAPYPNLSLNLGSRGSSRRASQLKCSGLVACFIQASFFGYVTWATWYSREFRTEANAAEPLPFFVLCTSGTVMLTIGMTISAMLIDHNSAERLFIRDPSITVGEDNSSHFFWLQPGDQRVGDQVFPVFAHNEKRDSYITSWKVAAKQDGLEWRVRFAILSSLLGWICQFVGLRGLHASAGLYHLGVTLVMSFLRAMLRSGSAQPPKKSQLLPALSTVPADHGLDWQALELGLMRWKPPPSLLDTPISMDWCIYDEIDILSSKPPTLADKSDDGMHFNYFYAASDYSKIGVVGLVTRAWHRELCHHLKRPHDLIQPESIVKLCQVLERSKMSSTNATTTADYGVLPTLGIGAKIAHIRSRLARLTAASSSLTAVSWDYDIRQVSRRLAAAIRQTLDYLEPQTEDALEWRPYYNSQTSGIPPPSLHAIVWSMTLHLRLGDAFEEKSPLIFHALKDGNQWQVDESALEAAVGLRSLARKQSYQGLNRMLCPWCGRHCSYAKMSQTREKFMVITALDAGAYSTVIPPPSGVLELPPCHFPRNHSLSPLRFCTFRSTSSVEDLVAQDIFAAFLERLSFISFGLRGPLMRLVRFLDPEPKDEKKRDNSGENPGKPKESEKLVDILISNHIASEAEAEVTIYGTLLQRVRTTESETYFLDHSEALIDQLRMKGDCLGAELELYGWRYWKPSEQDSAMSEQDRARRNRAEGDIIRERSMCVPKYLLSTEWDLGHGIYKGRWERLLQAALGNLEARAGLILDDKVLHEGYEVAIMISIEKSIQHARLHKEEPLPPLDNLALAALVSKGRTSDAIGDALSLASRYSFSSSAFEVRSRLFRHALELGLVGLLQDLYTSERQLADHDRTVNGTADQALLAISRPYERQRLYDTLNFFHAIAKNEVDSLIPWQGTLDATVAACISDDEVLADFILGARAFFPNIACACLLIFGNFRNVQAELELADTFLKRQAMIFAHNLEDYEKLRARRYSQDPSLEFLYSGVRWGQPELVNKAEWLIKDSPIGIGRDSNHVRTMRLLSRYGTALLRGLSSEEKAWATRQGFTVPDGVAVPEIIQKFVIKFLTAQREE